LAVIAIAKQGLRLSMLRIPGRTPRSTQFARRLGFGRGELALCQGDRPMLAQAQAA
jgi:hypothetical protein